MAGRIRPAKVPNFVPQLDDRSTAAQQIEEQHDNRNNEHEVNKASTNVETESQ
jgi:hypothetical protein